MASVSDAFMWELAEIDTVLKDLVDILHKVASYMAIWTLNVSISIRISISPSSIMSSFLSLVNLLGIQLSFLWTHFH
jgi:hypothetical protein